MYNSGATVIHLLHLPPAFCSHWDAARFSAPPRRAVNHRLTAAQCCRCGLTAPEPVADGAASGGASWARRTADISSTPVVCLSLSLSPVYFPLCCFCLLCLPLYRSISSPRPLFLPTPLHTFVLPFITCLRSILSFPPMMEPAGRHKQIPSGWQPPPELLLPHCHHHTQVIKWCAGLFSDGVASYLCGGEDVPGCVIVMMFEHGSRLDQ